ncbi:MAG: hypothetical protein R2751_14790 [Bacteroidales bacterium]
MKIDFNNGAFIEIGGELGRYNSLPIDVLIKIAQHLQDLVFTIAKYDLPTSESIDLSNFKIELVGFNKGSAVPKFAFTPRSENKTGLHWQVHRNTVNEKFEKLVEISNTGDYSKLFELYPEPAKRNPIVEDLYSFANGFGSAPVKFVDYDEVNEESTPIYKLNRFKPALKKDLIGEIKEVEETVAETDEAVGKIKISKRGERTYRKIINTYSSSKFSLEYAPETIHIGTRKYTLKYPLRCLFAKEDAFYIIQSEMLGIIGTGMTEEEAEESFSEEFDYLYQRLGSFEATRLTNHNLLIKNIITQIVEKVEE